MPLKRKKLKQNKINVVKDFIEIAGVSLEKRFGEIFLPAKIL